MVNYIVYDLEGTCWMDGQKRESEIIEIGAVKVNENKEIIDTFQRFIKPTFYPYLSGYCKSLTRITQRDIDKADNFQTVLNEFIEWIGEDYYLCAWGSDKITFKKNCQLNNFQMDWLKNNNDIQEQFSRTRLEQNKIYSLKNAIKLMDIEVKGRKHRAIYDAINTTQIFIKVFDEFTFEKNTYENILVKKKRKKRKKKFTT